MNSRAILAAAVCPPGRRRRLPDLRRRGSCGQPQMLTLPRYGNADIRRDVVHTRIVE